MEKLLKNPKVIVFYLPQFHRVPENDEWWGEGYTEWVAAKNAKPLYPGHYQPRLPAHDNYYNLLDKSTLEWQAKLARRANIYGFCIYHYWFGNNKKILEKPAEKLLEWRDINIKYCFSWANGSWIASWSKIIEDGAGSWTDLGKKCKMSNNGMLMRQEYGNYDEWVRHFMYLLPFFQDERYIKKDNKPVFMIYKPGLIACLSGIIKVWNELAKENGFSGIYFIGTNIKKTDNRYKRFNAIVRFEPNYTMGHEYNKKARFRKKLCEKFNMKIPYFINYDNFWRVILNRKAERKVYPGALVDYDCTPRRGLNAIMMVKATPEKFYQYFNKLIESCKRNGTEYVFLGAWNEWGEGAYLEPDKKNGYAYLKAIRECLKNS